MVPGAERRAVSEIVRATGGPEHDVVVVQVPVGRAARNRAAPAIALEDTVLARNPAILRAPGLEGVIEHPLDGGAFGRETAARALDLAADGADDGAEQASYVGGRGEEEARRLGLRGIRIRGLGLRTCLPVWLQLGLQAGLDSTQRTVDIVV